MVTFAPEPNNGKARCLIRHTTFYTPQWHFQSAERIVLISKGHRMNQHSMKVRKSSKCTLNAIGLVRKNAQTEAFAFWLKQKKSIDFSRNPRGFEYLQDGGLLQKSCLERFS